MLLLLRLWLVSATTVNFQLLGMGATVASNKPHRHNQLIITKLCYQQCLFTYIFVRIFIDVSALA